MLESAFRTAVLAKLPRHIHRQPMLAGMMGTAGTPDTYFDYITDLWCEWKVLPADDKLPAVVPAKSLPTVAQRDWLDRRWNAGRNAIVIVGVKLRGRAHGFVLDSPPAWSTAPLRDHYEQNLCSAADLAKYIEERVSCFPSSAPSRSCS